VLTADHLQDQDFDRGTQSYGWPSQSQWPTAGVSHSLWPWIIVWRVDVILCRGYFAQHHVDSLTPTMSPVQYLASKFPGKTEQEYRSHLGNFQISGMTGCVTFLGTLGFLCDDRGMAQSTVDWHAVWRSEIKSGFCGTVNAKATCLVVGRSM